MLCINTALASQAHAQERTRSLSDDDLRAEGWEFDAERATPGNALAGVAALSVGTVWHGAGHALVGDRLTANRLLAAEGISVAALLTGVAMSGVGEGSVAAQIVGANLQVGAGSLFAASWVADAVGTFKGTGSELPQSTAELRGLSAEVYVTTLVEQGVGLQNILVTRLPLVTERWALRPLAEASVDWGYRRFGVDASHRLPLGSLRRSFVEFGVAGSDENVSQHGYVRSSVAGFFATRVDLGDIFDHLSGLIWTHRIDAVTDFYAFDHDGRRRFQPEDRVFHVPAETGLGFNLREGVNLGLGYRHRRDELVGMAGRHLGAFWGRLGIVPRDRIGVDMRLEQGAFTRVWFGLQWTLVSGA